MIHNLAPKIIAEQLRQPNGELAVSIGEKMNKDNLLINQFTIENLRLLNNDKVLEIGMGNGHFVENIFHINNSIQYTGCDFSEIMVKEAHAKNEQLIKQGKVNFLVGSVEKLHFGDATFDKVFAVHSIYFWKNQKIALAEIYRVLKPNGQLTISIRPKSIMEHYPYVEFGFTLFSKDDLIELLSENHFKVLEILENDEYVKEINRQNTQISALVITAVRQ